MTFGEKREASERASEGESARRRKPTLSLPLSFCSSNFLTSVTIQQRRVGAIEHGSARGDDKHGHARAVLGGDKDLSALELGRRVKVTLEGGLAEERRGLWRVQIHAASCFEV